MKIIVAPDKFKGSLSAREVCDCIESGVLAVFPEADVEKVPLADGGEGTLDIMIETLGLQIVRTRVMDPLFREISSYYGIKDNTAYIEMALASGLPLLSDDERSAMKASSYGTGQLMKHAIDNGARHIVLFVGGSASSDGGIGMAAALGFEFLDAAGAAVNPTGANLGSVHAIGLTPFDVGISLVTDVQSPLLGARGAVGTYARQKGATDSDMQLLEAGLSHYVDMVEQATSASIRDLPGAGAAGGMAVSVVGLLNGRITPGIETILQTVRFDDRIRDGDLIITGEGKVDDQTLHGKVVSGVARAASTANTPCIVFCGICMAPPEQLQSLKLAGIASIKQAGLSTNYCMQNAAPLLVERVTTLLRDMYKL